MSNLVGDSAVQSTPAVQGTNTAGGLGVYGVSTTGTAGSAGVEGYAGGGGIGVYGVSNSGPAVMGEGGSVGVLGKNYVNGAYAVRAWQGAVGNTSVYTYGVYSQCGALNGVGVWASGATGGVGIWGECVDIGVLGKGGLYGVEGVYTGTGSGYSGYFNSMVYVAGYLSKGGGGFRIDHPTDPENKVLNHFFVESPEMKNVYDGIATFDANGEVTITMPSYFDSCNSDCKYQLTPVGKWMPLFISSEMKSGVFSIGGGVAGMKVSWQVTSSRADKWALANNPGVEVDKATEDKGLFIHPELFGHGKDKSIHHCERMLEKK